MSSDKQTEGMNKLRVALIISNYAKAQGNKNIQQAKNKIKYLQLKEKFIYGEFEEK